MKKFLFLYCNNNKDDNNFNKKILWSFKEDHNFEKIYFYLYKDKNNIIKDHKIKTNKSCVYLLFNKVSNHFYVGSSTNIVRRLRNYLNINYLNLQKNINMPICKALLKYGYDNFSLIIVKYVAEFNLIKRESFWIKSLNPYYNVLLEVYSSIGYKHTEEIRKKLKNIKTGSFHKDETKKLISINLKGSKNLVKSILWKQSYLYPNTSLKGKFLFMIIC